MCIGIAPLNAVKLILIDEKLWKYRNNFTLNWFLLNFGEMCFFEEKYK